MSSNNQVRMCKVEEEDLMGVETDIVEDFIEEEDDFLLLIAVDVEDSYLCGEEEMVFMVVTQTTIITKEDRFITIRTIREEVIEVRITKIMEEDSVEEEGTLALTTTGLITQKEIIIVMFIGMIVIGIIGA